MIPTEMNPKNRQFSVSCEKNFTTRDVTTISAAKPVTGLKLVLIPYYDFITQVHTVGHLQQYTPQINS